jgi:hypothetical protein
MTPQILHIFKKDVRGLVGEISVFLAIVILWWGTSVFGPEEAFPEVMEALVFAAACYLTARAFHADGAVGDREFWKTRPFRWQSLVAAKVLFLVLSIHLPLVVARTAILGSAGFEIVPHIPGLLWTQLLMFLCVSLPAAAVAAMTSGLVSFFPAAAGVLGAGVALAPVPITSRFLAELRNSYHSVSDYYWWLEFDWVRQIAVVFAAGAVALVLIFGQYRRLPTAYRRTLLATGILTIVVCRFAPFDFGWAVQSTFSTSVLSANNLDFTLGSPRALWAFRGNDILPQWPPDSFQDVGVNVYVPLNVQGVDLSAGRDVQMTLNRLTVEVDGESLLMPGPPFGPTGCCSLEKLEGINVLFLHFHDGSIYEKLREKGANLRGTIRVVEYEKESTSVPVADFPANVRDSVRCSTRLESTKVDKRLMRCQTAIGPSSGFMLLRPFDQLPYPFAPFPLTLRLNPVWSVSSWSYLDSTVEDVEFEFRKPVAYALRDFEFTGVRLIEDSQTRMGGNVWGRR